MNLYANALSILESIIYLSTGIFDIDLKSLSPAGIKSDEGPLMSFSSTSFVWLMVNEGIPTILSWSSKKISLCSSISDKMLSSPSATIATTSPHFLQTILNGYKYSTC